MVENNTGDQAGYGLYGHSMTTNAQQVTSPFTYGQATSAYVPAEPSHDTPEQGTYSYGYSYGDDYTPQVDTSYQPANTYTPSDTTYQPSDATVPPYQTNPTTQPSYNNNNNNNDDDDDLGFGNSSIKKKNKGISESEENKEQGDQPREVSKDESGKESAKGGGWGIFSLFSRKSHVEEKKPIKANLGDENQFYFDEKEKRWVWKSNNAQPAATPTNATPPPPKAMTPQPSTTSMSPPSSAPKPTSIPPRVNSAPVGPPSHTAAPPTGASPAISTLPSAGARRAGGGRKPMRSRYVDVFNQPSS
ncbi:hypothetical protein RMCBS344292_10886 [Rhizopus microsporus]|nr:hypothetical protein RMCBS344292_10886 [Rhizopus microsporus]